VPWSIEIIAVAIDYDPNICTKINSNFLKWQ